MIFWGTTRAGTRMLLGQPASAVFSFDQDAPADLLRAQFPADKLWEELREIAGYEGDRVVFRGLADEQNMTLSSSGLTAELVCRSREALLLDSEAPPGTMAGAGLVMLEDRLLLPLGLELGEGDRTQKVRELSVSKGESVWSVLARFCRSALGTEPFVDLDGKVQCGGSAGRTLELTDILSAQVSFLPCKRIGEVWVQSARGTYDTRFQGDKDVRRRRYLSAISGRTPGAVLAAGERDSFRLTVTCAGEIWPGKNAVVSVTVPGLGRFENCPVKSAQIRRDQSGSRTKFVLERGEQACG